MYCKCLVKLTAGLMLLQLAGYVMFIQYSPSWSIFSLLSASTKIVRNRDGLKNSEHDSEIEKNERIDADMRVATLRLAPSITAFSKNITIRDVIHKVPTTQAMTKSVASSDKVGDVASIATVNVVNHTTFAKFLMQEVTNLLKTQLELHNPMPPFSVKTPCVPESKSKTACVHPNCTQLSNNISERVHSLFSEKTVLTKAQDDLLSSIAAQIPETDVILVTAASSNHYDEMQAMLHSLHSTVFPELSKHENFSLVLWDLGLTWDQRKKTEKCCRCQVISFPFEKFPQSIKTLQCYMWKPLVIRMSQLRARKYAVWQDASIRYVSYPGPVFENGRQHGLQLSRSRAGVSTSYRTLPETFAYLGQKVCSFYPYPEITAGFGVYKNDPFVLKAVTNPWARCGFEKDCMCPKPYLQSSRCYYGPCHRFDQSALTIITATLYSSEMYKILLFKPELMRRYFWIKRNDAEANYFNSTGCLS